jgi:uncharacterized protein with FMN-binding domain
MAKNKLATALIVGASLAGAFVLTEQITPGIQSLIQNSGTGTQSGQDQTVQSDPVQYQYGTVQVEVVRSAGKITAVNMLQTGATAGREQAFPALVDAAIQAQGSGFGNLSGATTTTEAFKQALDSAIAKFN